MPSPHHLTLLHPHPHPSRQVPGTVKDVVEGEGPNASVFSVVDVPQPTPANGSYVSDASGLISPTALLYLNRNMSLMERSTPFRVLLVVMARPAQPSPAPRPAPPSAQPRVRVVSTCVASTRQVHGVHSECMASAWQVQVRGK